MDLLAPAAARTRCRRAIRGTIGIPSDAHGSNKVDALAYCDTTLSQWDMADEPCYSTTRTSDVLVTMTAAWR